MPQQKKFNVAILDDYQGVSQSYADWSPLAKHCNVTVFRDHLDGEADIATRLADIDIICVMRERTPLSRSLIERLPNVKLVVTTAGHNAAIDGDALRERGIPLCGTGATTNPTVELTWGLIIALARHLIPEQQAVRNGGWQSTIGTDLKGSTLGIVGLGKLGSEIARLGAAFGMRLIAWSQNLTDEHAASVGATRVSKEALFQQSDFITVHLKLSPRSTGIIGAHEFSLMKPQAFFVNTSRGPLVDERALIDVLEERRIAGAAIDVYDAEPLGAGHPFRRLDRLLATPHVGYVAHENYRRFYGDTVENIRAWLDGAPIRVIN
jgi:phosphoglycerate dehydrogenase-like enzyme